MKRSIATVLCTLLMVSLGFSQDVIVLKKDADIQGKVLEVTPSEVKYRKADNPDGPLFSIPKADVLSIEYANGTKDVFDKPMALERQPGDATPKPDLYMRGQADAMLYYHSYKPAGTGTLVVSLISPLAGLIPAVACASTPPKEHNLDYPSKDMMRQPDYHEGYANKARKIKRGKVWKNWGIALGVNFGLILMLSAGN